MRLDFELEGQVDVFLHVDDRQEVRHEKQVVRRRVLLVRARVQRAGPVQSRDQLLLADFVLVVVHERVRARRVLARRPRIGLELGALFHRLPRDGSFDRVAALVVLKVDVRGFGVCHQRVDFVEVDFVGQHDQAPRHRVDE